jgi:membrane protein YqaA with SNARE-associated domain
MLWARAAGAPGLFCASFLASTVVPLGSEPLLIAQVYGGYLTKVEALLWAGAGNTLGSYTTYYLGRVFPKPVESKATRIIQKYGAWSALLSWLPFIGDPLTFGLGVVRSPALFVFPLLMLGKLARYGFILLGLP